MKSETGILYRHYQPQFNAAIKEAISSKNNSSVADFAKYYSLIQGEETVTPRELGISLDKLNLAANKFKKILGRAYQVSESTLSDGTTLLVPHYLRPEDMTGLNFQTDIDNYKEHNKQIFDRFPPALKAKIETEINKQNAIKHTCAMV